MPGFSWSEFHRHSGVHGLLGAALVAGAVGKKADPIGSVGAVEAIFVLPVTIGDKPIDKMRIFCAP